MPFTWRVLILLFALTLRITASRTVAAGDWPQNYIVHKDSKSPNGHYAVLVLSKEAAIDQDQTEGNTTYLANLQTRQTIGEIRGTDYFEDQNHRDLTVAWAPDSKWGVVTDWGRFGFGASWILEPKDSSFTQTDIGKRIQKSLDSVIQKQSNNRDITGDAALYFRLSPDRKVRVRALSSNNPKQFEGVKTYYALFQGTFDLESKKWMTTDARPIASEQDDALQSAYQDDFAAHMIVAPHSEQVPDNFSGTVFASEEEKAEALDRQMNDVYHAIRFVLPADRFARVKQEQIAWLKTRDAAESVEKKSKLTENRIRALQDLLW